MKRCVCSFVLCLLLLLCAWPAWGAGAEDFSDVEPGYWAYDYIDDVVDRGLFQGAADTRFEPSGVMTRAMFITVLGRLAGASVNEADTGGFTDVQPHSWYSGYVAWARAGGVAGGTSASTFSPEMPVTREQMAAILYNFCRGNQFVLPLAGGGNARFSDSGKISGYAVAGVNYCFQSGLISGYGDNSFQPQGLSTRAEVAAVISRLASLSKTDAASADTYTVTFHLNNGAAATVLTLWPEEELSQPDDPTRPGYIFLGWCSNSELTLLYDFSQPLGGDLSLYAKWMAQPDW